MDDLKPEDLDGMTEREIVMNLKAGRLQRNMPYFPLPGASVQMGPFIGAIRRARHEAERDRKPVADTPMVVKVEPSKAATDAKQAVDQPAKDKNDGE